MIARHSRRTAAMVLVASALVALVGCGGTGRGSAPTADGGSSGAGTEINHATEEIRDGTYLAVNLTENRNERAAVVVLDGESVMHTYSDCWHGTTTITGVRSEDQISWDHEDEFPGFMVPRIDDSGVVGFHLSGAGSIAYLDEFFPEDFQGLADDLVEFNQRCDFPVPEA